MIFSFPPVIKYSFLFLLFCTISQSHAQSSANKAYYFTGEITVGNYAGVDLHANLLLNEEYSFKVGYSGYIRQPKSAPPYYSSGFIGAMTFGLTNAFDQLGSYQILAGKIFSFNKKGTIRANISLGFGLAVIREPTNWQPIENNFVYGNYSFDYNTYNTISLIVNPKIEFPFTRFYGLTISPMLQINKDRTYIGIGIGQMIGLLRNKPEQINQ